MKMNSYLITTLVAALVSGVAVWFFEAIRTYMYRAKLAIWACEYLDDGHNRYFFLSVTNYGRNTARACVPQLTIHLKDWNKVLDSGMVNNATIAGHGSAGIDNIPAYWERVDRPLEINIHPGQSQRITIGAASLVRSNEFGYIFTIPSELGYKFPRFQFGGGGFEFLARVGSDNAKPIIRFGQVLDAGDYPATIEISGGPTPGFQWQPPKRSFRQKLRNASASSRAVSWIRALIVLFSERI